MSPFARMARRSASALLGGMLVFAGPEMRAIEAASGGSAPAEAPARKGDDAALLVLDWLELLPPGERSGFGAVPPPPMHDYLMGESGPAAAQSQSYGVNKDLDGMTVKLPGFVVPLELSPQKRVTEFLLVPYFGACIHVPPPPPNQIVYVRYPKGLELDSIYEPQWITGKLSAKTRGTQYGSAAYTIESTKVETYTY